MPSDPVITFEASSRSKGAIVHVTSDVGAQIFYTVNGDKPTDQSPLYQAAFPVASGVTVQAIAKDSANNLSQVTSEGFPERGWAKSRLAWAVGGFGLLVVFVLLVAMGVAHHYERALFGAGTENTIGLTTSACVVGCLFLVLTAFFLGETSLVLNCILAEMLGCGAGWLLGTYFSPLGSGEAQTFQQIGLTIGTLLSGVFLSKFLRVVDIYLDPAREAYGRVVLLSAYFLTAALFISVTVYVDRAYGAGLSITAEKPIQDTSEGMATESVISTSAGSICVVCPKMQTFCISQQTSGMMYRFRWSN